MLLLAASGWMPLHGPAYFDEVYWAIKLVNTLDLASIIDTLYTALGTTAADSRSQLLLSCVCVQAVPQFVHAMLPVALHPALRYILAIPVLVLLLQDCWWWQHLVCGAGGRLTVAA